METLQPAQAEITQPETAFDLALLASVGIDVDLVYEGAPTGCPHCIALVSPGLEAAA